MGILEKFSLAGKGAFVTGGARGIGKSVAQAFVEAGADVMLADVDLETAQTSAQELTACGPGRVLAMACDVTKPQDAVALADAVVRVPEHAQLVLRVGRAPDGAAALPETPRRPLRYVLLV